MAEGQVDVDAYTWPFQLTKSMHRDVYAAVDPKDPALSAAGKTVMVTGGGGTVGGEVAKAWAIASASCIVLVGRNIAPLEKVESALQSINAKIKVVIRSADTSVEDSVKALFESLVKDSIKVDVVVDSAGAINNAVSGSIEPSKWWNDFEANVKGPYLLAHYMMSTYGNKGGTLIVMGSNAASLVFPGMSSYNSSKLAVMRVLEFLQTEHPEMRFFTLSPGNVKSPLTNPNFEVFAKDTGLLAGGWSLFLATSRADYLKGSFLNVNWDVDEMEAHKGEIEGENLLKIGFVRAQLGPSGHPFRT